MNVFIPPELYELIKHLAEQNASTEVEALKRAVVICTFFDDAIAKGSKVLMLRSDGDLKECDFR